MSENLNLSDRELRDLLSRAQSSSADWGESKNVSRTDLVDFVAGVADTEQQSVVESELERDSALRSFVHELKRDCAPLLEEQALAELGDSIRASLSRPVKLQFLQAASDLLNRASQSIDQAGKSLKEAGDAALSALSEPLIPAEWVLAPVGQQGFTQKSEELYLSGPEQNSQRVKLVFEAVEDGVRVLADGPADLHGRTLCIGGEDGIYLDFERESDQAEWSSANGLIPTEACESGETGMAIPHEWV